MKQVAGGPWGAEGAGGVRARVWAPAEGAAPQGRKSDCREHRHAHKRGCWQWGQCVRFGGSAAAAAAAAARRAMRAARSQRRGRRAAAAVETSVSPYSASPVTEGAVEGERLAGKRTEPLRGVPGGVPPSPPFICCDSRPVDSRTTSTATLTFSGEPQMLRGKEGEREGGEAATAG